MIFRILLRKFLEGRGYTRYQTRRLMVKINWEIVREFIKIYGPTLLTIFLQLLPLFLKMEAPHTLSQVGSDEEKEDYDIDLQQDSSITITEQLI